MNYSRLAPILALVMTCLVAACDKPQQQLAPKWMQQVDAADAIYTGGDIVTMNDRQPSAEALAVKGGKIVAVGTRAEVEKAHKGASTRIIDLGGRTLVPGFLDAHSHYFSSLTVANQVNVYAPPAGPGKDPASIVAELVKYRDANKIPAGEVIQAYGYDENAMPKGHLLNRDDLDKALPDNPVLVGHVSMHGAVMNSAAMKKWNISAKTKTPPGGVIVRKPGTNEPYGLIMETAYLPVFASLPQPTDEQEIEWSKAGQLLFAQHGITTAHEGATHVGDLDVMTRAAAGGATLIDVIAYPFITDLDAVLKKYPKETWGTYQNRLKIGGVKITIDGSPQGKTAYFTSPYLTGGPGGEKKWSGELTFPEEVVTKAVKTVYDMGVPLNLHANGDGAIDAFLRAHESAAAGDLSQGPQRHDDPLAVRAQGPARQVRHLQDPPVVLHAAHLLLRRGAYRQPRQGAGDVHQPDARRHRQGLGADQPHRLRRCPSRPDVHDVVRGQPPVTRRRGDRRGSAHHAAGGAQSNDDQCRTPVRRAGVQGFA